MADVDNRLSAIDIPGRRFVIASDDEGRLSSDCSTAPAPDSASLRQLTGCRLDARTAAAELPAVRTTTGSGVGDRQRRQDHRQRRLWCLPQSMGVQRPAGTRADAAVLLCQNSHRCGGCGSADATDADGAARLGERNGRRQHDDLGLQNGVCQELLRVPSASNRRANDGRGQLSAVGHCRRRQLDGPECPGARARRDWTSPARARAGERDGYPLGWLFHLQRLDCTGRAETIRWAGVYGFLHVVKSDRRCIRPGRHVS